MGMKRYTMMLDGDVDEDALSVVEDDVGDWVRWDDAKELDDCLNSFNEELDEYSSWTLEIADIIGSDECELDKLRDDVYIEINRLRCTISEIQDVIKGTYGPGHFDQVVTVISQIVDEALEESGGQRKMVGDRSEGTRRMGTDTRRTGREVPPQSPGISGRRGEDQNPTRQGEGQHRMRRTVINVTSDQKDELDRLSLDNDLVGWKERLSDITEHPVEWLEENIGWIVFQYSTQDESGELTFEEM